MAKSKAKKTIGSVACAAILKGVSDEDALAAVKKAFPKASTKLASMKVYRSNLRKEVKEGKREAGKEGPPERQIGGLVREPQKMTQEAKDACKETRDTNRDNDWADRMAAQEERLKKMHPDPRRSHKHWLGAARKYKKLHGCWPSPSMLTEANLI